MASAIASAASRADHGEIGLASPPTGGEGEHRIAIAHGVRRHDRLGESIIGHHRHPRHLRFCQTCVGRDDADRRVFAGTRRGRAERPTRSSLRRSASDAVAVRTPATICPRQRIDDVANRVDGDDRRNDQPAWATQNAALPRPPFIAIVVRQPPILPTVAPAPAPTFPSATGPDEAALAAA